MWVTRCINIDYVYDMVIMLELDVDPSTFNRIRLYVISELVWNSMIPIMVNICFNKWCINGWIDYDDSNSSLIVVVWGVSVLSRRIYQGFDDFY